MCGFLASLWCYGDVCWFCDSCFLVCVVFILAFLDRIVHVTCCIGLAAFVCVGRYLFLFLTPAALVPRLHSLSPAPQKDPKSSNQESGNIIPKTPQKLKLAMGQKKHLRKPQLFWEHFSF